MTTQEFIDAFGLPLAKEILSDAPDWAKNFKFKHFEKRVAKSKRINTWGEQSFKELKDSHISTSGLISLAALKVAVRNSERCQ